MYTYAAVAFVAAAVSATATWQVQNWRVAYNERQRMEMQAKEQIRKTERIDAAAVAHEKDKVRIETKYRTITKEVIREVEKPVYRNVCISPLGVRDINELIEFDPAGEPSGTMSEAGATSERPR